MERLRLLAINGAAVDVDARRCLESPTLDAKTIALTRVAALIAVGGAVASYDAQSDEALANGATPAELVDVLEAVIPVVGLPRAVAAAPSLALALGYDIENALE
jgi:alkylhydroperoxidase/carboxymuconolactone decarboxylase family protein YurZ